MFATPGLSEVSRQHPVIYYLFPVNDVKSLENITESYEIEDPYDFS